MLHFEENLSLLTVYQLFCTGVDIFMPSSHIISASVPHDIYHKIMGSLWAFDITYFYIAAVYL